MQQALDLVRDAVALASAQPSRQSLSIATDFAFAAYWLMPRLSRFYAQHPNIDVSLVTSNRALSALAPDMDLAIVFGDGHLPRARGRLLFREEVFPVCSPQLLQRHGGDTAALLRAAPLLHLKPAAGQPWFDWPSVARGSDWGVAARDDGRGIRQLHAWCWVPRSRARVSPSAGATWSTICCSSPCCAACGTTPCSLAYGYHLLTAQHKKLSAGARTFVDWLLIELPGPEGGTVDSRHG